MLARLPKFLSDLSSPRREQDISTVKIGLEPFSLVGIIWFDSDLDMKQDEGSEVSYVIFSLCANSRPKFCSDLNIKR